MSAATASRAPNPWLIAVVVRAAVRKSLGFVGVNHRFGKLTGTGVDIEGAVALGLFWVVILLTLPSRTTPPPAPFTCLALCLTALIYRHGQRNKGLANCKTICT